MSALEAMDKPVLLLSASPGGAAHAHAQASAQALRTMTCRSSMAAHTCSRARASMRAGEATDPAMLAAALATALTQPAAVTASVRAADG